MDGVFHREQSESIARNLSDAEHHEAARYVIYLHDLLDAVEATHAACHPSVCPTVAALRRAAR